MDEPKPPEPRDRPQPEGEAVKDSFLNRAERHLWRKVVSGFLVVVPLAITFIVLRIVVVFLDDILRPSLENTYLDFPGIGLVILLIGLYLIGAIVSARLGRRAFDVQGAVLTRVPVVKSIYVLARQATDALSTPMERKINRVVFIEWPRPGFMALGFVIMLFYLIMSLINGKKASHNPWGGNSLEWHCQSPPIHENFKSAPTVGDCYDFNGLVWDPKTEGYIPKGT